MGDRRLATFYIAHSELTEVQQWYMASWERSVSLRTGGVTKFEGQGWEYNRGYATEEPVIVYQLIFEECLTWVRQYVKALAVGLAKGLGQERVLVTLSEVEVL